MKATETFEKAIESAMEDRALNDPAFMEAYSNDKKSLKDCVTYILNQVKQSGVNGFADNEIFDMAAEYFTTDVKVGSRERGKVVINRTVELTEGEKAEAKEKAFEELKSEIKSKARKKAEPKKKKAAAKPKTEAKKEAKPKAEKPTPPPQPTLF